MNPAEENKDLNSESQGQEVQTEASENTPEQTPETTNESPIEAAAVAETAEAATEAVADKVEETVEATTEAVAETAEAATDAVEETVEAASETVGETVESAIEAANDAVEAVKEVVPHTPRKATPPENFDWDEFEHGQSTYNEEQVAQMDEIYGNTLNSINEQEVMEGSIVAMTKKEVVVNVGYKSEGVIALNEFRYNPDLAMGDKVLVYVESTEDRNGQLVLSHRLARLHGAWDRVNQAMEDNEIITGFVKCRTKGGLIADVFGIEAFLPGSQIDVKPIRDYDQYVGKNMEFKVVKINHEFKNVVVSHKALIEAEIEEQKKQIIAGLEKGQVLEGIVKNITSYGVFVDLGGVDGLVHINEMSWKRIKHPSDVMKEGDVIEVTIINVDKEKEKISLGLKNIENNPWNDIESLYSVGKVYEGEVVRLAGFGAFVRIGDGIDGLVHISEISHQRIETPASVLSEGQKVKVKVLKIDAKGQKISLSIKETTVDEEAVELDKYTTSEEATTSLESVFKDILKDLK